MTDATKMAIEALGGLIESVTGVDQVSAVNQARTALAALRAKPGHSELVKRLRNFDFGSSDVDQWIEIMDEAADALEGKAIGETME